MQPDLEKQRKAIVDSIEERGKGEVEDSVSPEADEQEVTKRRDDILKTMLNTPPDPKGRQKKKKR